MSVTKIKDLNSKIDYKLGSIEDREAVVTDILSDDYYVDYFSDNFKVNLNSGDKLSDENEVCNSLERLANYLLNSDEVKEDKKADDFEYKFYSDEEAFSKAINKEPKLDGMATGTTQENVLHFLKKENRNFKLSKDQKITRADVNRDDELGQVLRDYTDYLEKISAELNDFKNSKLSRFRLSAISGQLKNDMIHSKDMLLGVFGYKTENDESTVIDWDQFDFKNKNHVKAMLFMKPGRRADEDLQYLIEDFDIALKNAKPTKLQKEIVELMRDNKGPTDIGRELGMSKQRVSKNIDMLVIRIVEQAEQD